MIAQEPASGSILVSIVSPAIQLLFDGRTQRLMLIEAHQQSNSTSGSINFGPPLEEWIAYRHQAISLAVGANDPGVTLRVIHRESVKICLITHQLKIEAFGWG